jgi:hypothetical protein
MDLREIEWGGVNWVNLVKDMNQWRVFVSAVMNHWVLQMLRNYPQSSSTLWNYSKCGVYTVESEAGC